MTTINNFNTEKRVMIVTDFIKTEKWEGVRVFDGNKYYLSHGVMLFEELPHRQYEVVESIDWVKLYTNWNNNLKNIKLERFNQCKECNSNIEHKNSSYIYYPRSESVIPKINYVLCDFCFLKNTTFKVSLD